jgi:hypothetical protein
MAQALVPPTVSDGLDGVGDFLTSVNNYERLYNAENSVEGYSTAKGKQKQKLNKEVRKNVGGEIDSMVEEGTISPGEVKHTYQSSFDKGKDFGGEVGLNGVYGDEYVLHGHYNEDGTTKPGSVGIKKSSDPKGMRIAHGVDDSLGGDSKELFDHFST